MLLENDLQCILLVLLDVVDVEPLKWLVILCFPHVKNWIALERAGVEPIVKWDMAETAKGGPFPELLNVEVLLNAILLNADDPPPVQKNEKTKQKRI